MKVGDWEVWAHPLFLERGLPVQVLLEMDPLQLTLQQQSGRMVCISQTRPLHCLAERGAGGVIMIVLGLIPKITLMSGVPITASISSRDR